MSNKRPLVAFSRELEGYKYRAISHNGSALLQLCHAWDTEFRTVRKIPIDEFRELWASLDGTLLTFARLCCGSYE